MDIWKYTYYLNGWEGMGKFITHISFTYIFIMINSSISNQLWARAIIRCIYFRHYKPGRFFKEENMLSHDTSSIITPEFANNIKIGTRRLSPIEIWTKIPIRMDGIWGKKIKHISNKQYRMRGEYAIHTIFIYT